jgi:hypothetical protein
MKNLIPCLIFTAACSGFSDSPHPPLMHDNLNTADSAAFDSSADSPSDSSANCCNPVEPFACGVEAGKWPDGSCPDAGLTD